MTVSERIQATYAAFYLEHGKGPFAIGMSHELWDMWCEEREEAFPQVAKTYLYIDGAMMPDSMVAVDRQLWDYNEKRKEVERDRKAKERAIQNAKAAAINAGTRPIMRRPY